MTTYYVDSAAGSNTSPYDTWAKAATALATIASIDAAGDTIYVASTHAESSSSNISLSWAGTLAAPTRILCASKSAEPPTALATTATVTTTSTGTIVVNSAAASVIYMYGITFISGSGASGNNTIAAAGTEAMYESCSFQLATTGSGGTIAMTGRYYKNCTVKFGAAGQLVTNAFGSVNVGGSILAGGTSPTIFTSSGGGSYIHWDFSNASSSMSLTNLGSSSTGSISFYIKCKMPSGWGGALDSTVPGNNTNIRLIDCDSAGTNYTYHLAKINGDVYSETTLVRSGGASDGTTPISRKMVGASTLGVFPLNLDSDEIAIWNDTTGSSVTATIEVLHDSATNLTDAEIWMECRYLSASDSPLGGLITDAKADVLASAADQTTSSVTWTTTGMSNPNKQKLSVTFTPQQKGYVYAKVKLCKASYTVYVDPVITLS